MSAELTTDPAALVTEATALVTGLPAAASPEGPAEAEPASAETAEVTEGAAGGGSSPVAAWACLEKSKRMKKIPAAATASCAARTAARRASGCGIDSSHPQETGSCTPGLEGQGTAVHDR
jgi:hypothetical protein